MDKTKKKNIEGIIREAVSKIIPSDISAENIDINDELEEVGLDSLSFIELIVMLEKEFQYEFPDEKLLISELNTINKICTTIEQIYRLEK